MTDETTGLRERIDGWLDGLPQPAAQPLVQQAIASGDRIRRRRRQGTALAVAAAVAAIGVGGALLRTEVTGPSPAPTPGGPGPSTSSTATTTVRYPDGSVTWPAPGAGGTWVLPGVGKLARTELGQVLRGDILTAAPGTAPLGGGPGYVVPGAGVAESGVAGRVTDVRVEVNDVDGPRLGLLTVRMTRGGLSAEPLAGVLDPCGTWPADSRGPGLLDGERSAYFENFPQRTCALHRSGGSTVVRWEGHGQEPDGGRSYATRIVFTVRPDGTAVYVSSSTRFQLAARYGPDLARPRDWSELERLAATLRVPDGLGG
jgi:hypothetical protein